MKKIRIYLLLENTKCLLSGHFSVATPRGRSCLSASQMETVKSPTRTGSSAQPADTLNASGMVCSELSMNHLLM